MPSNKKLLQAAAGSAGGDNLYPEDVFSTYLYAGSNGARTIANGISLSDEGGLVWLKNRGAVDSHVLFDTVNGPQKSLASNDTAAGSNYSSYLSFPSAGTSGWNLAGAALNGTGTTWASWSFRKAAGFCDIVTYTGNDTARTIAHNLGSVPKMIIVKSTSDAYDWVVYHASLTNQQNLNLNTTSQAGNSGAEYWNSTTATSSVFSLGNQFRVNGSGKTYVAYVFGDDAVFGEGGDEQICKMGSYTHDGSGNATINLGFEPQWVLAKASSTGGTWYIFDVMRGLPASGVTNGANYLRANATNAESSTSFMSISSTGFNITGMNANETWIYMAIRRPMKVPEAGTEVFSPYYGTLGSPITTNFPVDLSINNRNTGSSYSHFYTFTRPLGTYYLETATSAAAVDGGTASPKFDVMNSIDLSGWYGASSTVSAWNFKRAPKFMDVVAYSGTSSIRQQAHNLGVAPEFVIVKGRNFASHWYTYHSGQTGGSDALHSTMRINLTEASFDTQIWKNYDFNASTFSLDSDNGVNGSSYTYIAYLFATLAGISKVGSVVHSGTTNVDCGFSNGARFVFIKRTDAAGEWYFFDTANGIVAGSDNYWINPTGDRLTQDIIDPLASGFTLTSSFTAGTYIFLAIA